MPRLLLMYFMLLFVTTSGAGTPISSEAMVENRLKNLAAELRCLVCQNQSLADSQADLAIDLRNQVRDQIKAGRSDEEIKTYLVARYGDFVLYRPPVKDTTVLLWMGPFVLLLAGMASLVIYVRRRHTKQMATPLSEAERDHARRLLHGEAESAESVKGSGTHAP